MVSLLKSLNPAWSTFSAIFVDQDQRAMFAIRKLGGTGMLGRLKGRLGFESEIEDLSEERIWALASSK